jgi:hypothetical protein
VAINCVYPLPSTSMRDSKGPIENLQADFSFFAEQKIYEINFEKNLTFDSSLICAVCTDILCKIRVLRDGEIHELNVE